MIKLAPYCGTSTSNGTVPLSAPTATMASVPGAAAAAAGDSEDLPLDLCTKPGAPREDKDLSTLSSLQSSVLSGSLSSVLAGSLGAPPPAHSDRLSRRKPGPKPRRVAPAATPPAAHSPSLGGAPGAPSASLAQLFAAADMRPEDAENAAGAPHKDGRPRNLGRGVSKPKKNTVASLLAQSRALGLKPLPPGLDRLDAATLQQVSFLKSSLGMDFAGFDKGDYAIQMFHTEIFISVFFFSLFNTGWPCGFSFFFLIIYPFYKQGCIL